MPDAGDPSTREDRIAEILSALDVRAGGDLDQLLVELCPDDAGLRADVRRCWEARTAESTNPAQGPLIAAALAQAAACPPAPETATVNIPGYAIRRLVASGGMGSVYEAEQQFPQRRVALKLIRADRLVPEAQRRFKFETQALALLQHPCVAQVFDAGIVESAGLRWPYFAMEFVDGRRLTDHCLLAKTQVRDRLELVAQICDGVEHAHQKGVIHRDLKPDNILVTSDGRPKILDFGVGRAVAPDAALTTMETDAGRIIGTLPYMSPEQAAGAPQLLDTRSDVYALGVLMYELLTGRLPHELRGMTLPAALQTIREVEPPAVGKLRPGLRGDLDTIVSGALAKDREHRYGSAAALAADIRRYLRGEPISRRPLTAWYQFVKFAGRNRALVAGITSTLLALVAGLVVSLLLLARAETMRARAEYAERAQTRAAEQARARAGELAAVTDFQAEMLAGIDAEGIGRGLVAALRTPDAAASAALDRVLAGVGPTDIAVQLIDTHWLQRAAVALDREFAKAPRIRAALQQTLASAYRELALFDAAAPLQAAALATRRRELGTAHPDTLASIAEAGRLWRARGRLAEAESLYREALAGRRVALGATHADTLDSVNDLGELLAARGALHEAHRLYGEALEASRRGLGADDRLALRALSNQASVLQDLGRLDQAERLQRAALAGYRRSLGDDHPETLTCIDNLGTLLDLRGQYDEAETCYREALAGKRRVRGLAHPETLAALNNLGVLLREHARYDEAEACLQQALEVQRRVLGAVHPETLLSLSNLAFLFDARGDYERAEQFCYEALQGRLQVLGPEHPETLASMNNLGTLYLSLARPDEAELCLRAALHGRRLTLGEFHVDTLSSLNNLGQLLRQRGQLAAAEPYLRAGLEGCRAVLGEDHMNTITACNNVGSVLKLQGALREAEPYHRTAAETARRVLGPDHPHSLVLAVNLAHLLHQNGALAEAERRYRQVLADLRDQLGNDHPFTLRTVALLGHVLLESGRADEAEPSFREALDGFTRVYGPEHPDAIEATFNYGRLLEAQRQPLPAEDYLRDALARARTLDAQHPAALMALNGLCELLQAQDRLTEAEWFCQAAVDGSCAVFGPEHRATLTTLHNLGALRRAQGDDHGAETRYREALAGRRAALGDDHPDTLRSVNSLAGLLLTGDRLAEGTALLDAHESAARAAWRELPADLLEYLRQLGVARTRLADYPRAERLLLECHALVAELPDPEGPASRRVIAALVALYEAWARAEPGAGHAEQARRWRAGDTAGG